MAPKKDRSGLFERFSHQATMASGTSYAFLIALGVIVIWAVTGPIFGFSNTWQLVINTGTTIVTFLVVLIVGFPLVLLLRYTGRYVVIEL